MTPKKEMYTLMNPAQVWKLASVLILVCGLQLYGQQVDPRAAAAAKVAAGREARAYAAATQVPAATASGTFVTFDVPGAATSGTNPFGMNNAGVITGFYGTGHGFVRASNGTFVTFDIQGASLTAGLAVNEGGVVAGIYFDTNFIGHGFVRDPNGAIVTFDIAGAANGIGFGIGPSMAINPEGAVTGLYLDANFFIPHAFLRAPNGAITTFDAPGADFGTVPDSIDPEGAILGVYFDASGVSHGFLRSASGTFTEINGPDHLTGQFDGLNFGAPLTMNPKGEITGTYFQPISGHPFGGNQRVFVLSRDGNYIPFDAANYPPCCIFSAPAGINPSGTITGSFNDGLNIDHGFLRTRNGTLTTFDVPGAGTGSNQGTLPLGINPAGMIFGTYFDAMNVPHGFLFLPQ